MKPDRTKLALGASWILFWMLMIGIAILDYLRGGGRELWQPVLWECSSAFTVTALLVLQRRVTRTQDALIARPRRWFALQILWLPAYWAVFVPLVFAARHGVYALAGRVYSHPAWRAVFVYEAVKLSLFYLLFVVIVFGILSYRALLGEQLRLEQASALLRQAQLQRLAQQMQPHFLFNALNTISSLMRSDVERADATLVELADVLRATLELADQPEAPLATELRLVRGYARVMSERFAGRVEIAWEIDDGALACRVPVMSLQPLVENIFKHTVGRQRGSTRVVIGARREPGVLVLTASDDRGALNQADPACAPGVGLKNLRERLAALYGTEAVLTLSPLAPAGVRSEIRLPCAC